VQSLDVAIKEPFGHLALHQTQVAELPADIVEFFDGLGKLRIGAILGGPQLLDLGIGLVLGCLEFF